MTILNGLNLIVVKITLAIFCGLVSNWTVAIAQGHGPFLLGQSPIDELKAEIKGAGISLETASLIDGLANHPNDLVRASIADYLGLIKAKVAVGALLQVARKDESWLVRWSAAEALYRLDQPEGLDILRHELESEPKLTFRLMLAENLAKLGDASGYGVVHEAVSKPLFRWSAFRALVSFLRFEQFRPEIERLLVEAADDADPETRKFALVWLEQAHADGLLEWSVLQARLEKGLHDADPRVREKAKALSDRWRLIHLGRALEKTPPPPPKPGQPSHERRMP